MFEKGQKVRVREDTGPGAGHIATVQESEPIVDETKPEGAVAYRILFDDPADTTWFGWLSDTWREDWELEDPDGPNT